MAVAQRLFAPRPTIVVVVLASLSLIVIDRAGANAPTGEFRAVVRDGFASMSDTAEWLWPFDSSQQVRDLEERNAELAGELEALRATSRQAVDTERQRNDLLALLALPTPADVDKVAAPVIAMDSTNFDSTIELGKGASDGIAENMPVVTAEGLVGRVIEVSESRSSVLLITDSTSNVGVRVGATGDVGVAVGTGSGEHLRIDLIEAESPVTDGDVVVTNGRQGSLFPPGLLVGSVASSRAAELDLRRDVTMVPSVDFQRLDNVMVLKWESP